MLYLHHFPLYEQWVAMTVAMIRMIATVAGVVFLVLASVVLFVLVARAVVVIEVGPASVRSVLKCLRHQRSCCLWIAPFLLTEGLQIAENKTRTGILDTVEPRFLILFCHLTRTLANGTHVSFMGVHTDHSRCAAWPGQTLSLLTFSPPHFVSIQPPSAFSVVTSLSRIHLLIRTCICKNGRYKNVFTPTKPKQSAILHSKKCTFPIRVSMSSPKQLPPWERQKDVISLVGTFNPSVPLSL